jgi:hypothetical protein
VDRYGKRLASEQASTKNYSSRANSLLLRVAVTSVTPARWLYLPGVRIARR